MEFITENRYILVPIIVWFGIQLFKLIWDLITTKKFNFKKLMAPGGMPSSHSAVVCSVTTMIGLDQGFNSALFGLAAVMSFVVMYDAAGIRRAAGKQATILNKLMDTPGLSGEQVTERLAEVLGHTPVQVVVGALIGIIVGVIFG